MPVTFSREGAVGTITLDNPPANSYDLAVMQEFSAAVDEAIGSEARAVIVRSASPKFFSAGADVKKFLDGDVDANMAMIRTSQAAFRRWPGASRSSSRI
jgi:enoyl-CoA hydratase/carnithine racemase